jgi:biotin synthase-related radical SAM superfamily protein
VNDSPIEYTVSTNLLKNSRVIQDCIDALGNDTTTFPIHVQYPYSKDDLDNYFKIVELIFNPTDINTVFNPVFEPDFEPDFEPEDCIDCTLPYGNEIEIKELLNQLSANSWKLYIQLADYLDDSKTLDFLCTYVALFRLKEL